MSEESLILALQTDPTTQTKLALVSLGRNFLKEGQADHAKQIFSAVLTKDPDFY